METVIYKKSEFLTDTAFHYCPGCTHGTVHRIIADTLDKLVKKDEIIGIAPVGCAVFAYNYFNFDMQQASHGRAPAVATGIKRVQPQKVVFSYQGDGDLASIGLAEIVHAAARNEQITVIFINNGIYGMTGGQLAPTTLSGQRTTTSMKGRDSKTSGFPIRICEMLSTLYGNNYIERVSCHDSKHILLAEKAIKKAFQHQIDKKGFSLIEVLAGCPTNFRLTPTKMNEYISDKAMDYFPLGVFKDSI